jgi:hypothetical protein
MVLSGIEVERIVEMTGLSMERIEALAQS